MRRHILAFILLIAAPALSQTADGTPAPGSLPPAPSPQPNFFHRLARFYKEDWHPSPTAPPSTPPPRRGLPSPLDAPPFYTSDWGYGGSPTIGEPDTAPYPLHTAINGAHSRVKFYGWIEPSFNVSTSSDSNAPLADAVFPNEVVLNRAVFIVERLPDTVQQQHVDWGFHFTNLFGTDYRYNVGKGYLSSQLVDHARKYGYDAPFDYFDLYLPHVRQGMVIRAGRFSSVSGIESQAPPFNYAFSHSLLNINDPVTQTGIIATVKLSDQWLVQLGIIGGHDIALWSGDAKPSAVACVSYTTRSVDDNLYLCANGINDGVYAYNNVQQFDGTWYHRFSKTVHTSTEAWFMYQRDVPAVGGPIAPEPNSNGAFCHPGLFRCFAPEYAVVNYVQKELSAHDFISVRNEFLDDKRGQRTAFQTRYTEHSLSWTHWLGTTVQIRPEIRFERAWDTTAYDNGRSQNQLTVASDLVLHF